MDEHFSPTLGLDLTAYVETGDVSGTHHLIRDYWLPQVLRDMQNITRLLDAGCGDGYGSFLIASEFAQLQVLGVDYDPDAIKRAKKNY